MSLAAVATTLALALAAGRGSHHVEEVDCKKICGGLIDRCKDACKKAQGRADECRASCAQAADSCGENCAKKKQQQKNRAH